MNQILKLRHYTYSIRKFSGMAFKHTSNYVCYSHSLRLSITQMIDLNSLQFSFSQVREYAKKGQGKMPKGGKKKTMQLSDEEMADVINIEDYRHQLHQVTENLKKDYVENVSMRSAASNIVNIVVKINDEDYSLNELAVISKKNNNLIAINMSDFPEAIKPAIQAIIESGSGFNPQQEGTMLYVTIPKVTREHRETLAKNAKTIFGKAKDEIRSIQNSFIKDAKDKTELSEDLVFNTTNQIKAMADNCTADLEKILKEKQKELLGDS